MPIQVYPGKGGSHILDLELVGFLRTEDVEILGFEQPADDLLAVLPASGLLVGVGRTVL